MDTTPLYTFEEAIDALVNKSTLNEERKEYLRKLWNKKVEKEERMGFTSMKLSRSEAWRTFFSFPEYPGYYYFNDAIKFYLGSYSLESLAMSYLRGKWTEEVAKENHFSMMLSMRATKKLFLRELGDALKAKSVDNPKIKYILYWFSH